MLPRRELARDCLVCISIHDVRLEQRTLLPRVGRLERRLDLVQVGNHPFSRFGRETDACENLLELVVGPLAANVVGRFPDADDVERILTRGAVVAELTEGNGPPRSIISACPRSYTAFSLSMSPTNFAMSIAGMTPE